MLAESQMRLAGPSNAGLTEPGQCAALSLAQVSTTLGMLQPTLDNDVVLQMMAQLVHEIAEAFGQAHERQRRSVIRSAVGRSLRRLRSALPLCTVSEDFTNRFVWYRCRWVRAWGSRPSQRPAPVLACRYTPGRSSICHFER